MRIASLYYNPPSISSLAIFIRLEYAKQSIMLYRPLTSAFRNSPPSLTPFSSLPLSRTVASRCSQPAIFRSISSSIPSYRTFNSSKISSRPFPKPFACSPRRSFSSSGRKSYGFGNQPYKRFNNPQSQSFHWYLLSRAKPHHFVIIGLGISGFYIYNTDVVEVRLAAPNLPLVTDPENRGWVGG